MQIQPSLQQERKSHFCSLLNDAASTNSIAFTSAAATPSRIRPAALRQVPADRRLLPPTSGAIAWMILPACIPFVNAGANRAEQCDLVRRSRRQDGHALPTRLDRIRQHGQIGRRVIQHQRDKRKFADRFRMRDQLDRLRRRALLKIGLGRLGLLLSHEP